MKETTKTKAERLREIAEQSRKQAYAERVDEHKKYVNKLISNKLRFCATLGRTSASVKVRKKYSPTLTTEQFINQGFAVQPVSKNGRTTLTIKW